MIRLTNPTAKTRECDHCGQRRRVRFLHVNDVPVLRLCWDCVLLLGGLIETQRGRLRAANLRKGQGDEKPANVGTLP